MPTTIQISEKLKERLSDMRFSDNETYEDVIWNLLEDTMELSKETKNRIKESKEDINKGKIYSISKVKNILKI